MLFTNHIPVRYSRMETIQDAKLYNFFRKGIKFLLNYLYRQNVRYFLIPKQGVVCSFQSEETYYGIVVTVIYGIIYLRSVCLHVRRGQNVVNAEIHTAAVITDA